MVEFYGTEREKGILNHIKYEERKMKKRHYITMRCSAILFFVLSILSKWNSSDFKRYGDVVVT